MNKILLALLLGITLILNYSCTKDSTDDPADGGSTIAAELNPAKAQYSAHGGTFRFRVYNYAPVEGQPNNNNHEAIVEKIMERNNRIDILAGFVVPALGMQGNAAILNCEGEIISGDSPGKVFIQSQYFYGDYEILPNGELVSYTYIGGAHGSYGGIGASYHNHTQNTHNGPFSSSSNAGFMSRFNNQFFMLSMSFNSNGGRPMLYTYQPSTFTWDGQLVEAMTTVGIGTTWDASKVGNMDRMFWVWLSYDGTPENGRINITGYNGSEFSPVASLSGIGSIGTTQSMEYKHTIFLHKNPDQNDQPYMVVRRYGTDILDVYKFNGSTIETVVTGLTIPQEIPIISGSVRVYKELAFSGDDIYMITGKDKNLYKRSGNSFVVTNPGLTTDGQTITALEATPGGALISVHHSINSTPQPKTVSDVVFVANYQL